MIYIERERDSKDHKTANTFCGTHKKKSVPGKVCVWQNVIVSIRVLTLK